MPDSVTWRVDGLSALGDRLRKLGNPGAQRIATAMTSAAAQVIKKRAKRKIETNPSVDTGSLRDAVIVKKIPKSQTTLTSEHIVTARGRGKVSKKTGKKQPDAPYAAIVEFGSVHMPAEPYLRPAIDEGKQEAVEAMKARGAARLTKAGT